MKHTSVAVTGVLLLFSSLAQGHQAKAGAQISGAMKGISFPLTRDLGCATSECLPFRASGCNDATWTQENSDDPRATAGNGASIVFIPPEARGQNGFMEWKLTGVASQDAQNYFFISTDCSALLAGGPVLLSHDQVRIPANAGWFVVFKTFAQAGAIADVARSGPIWWRWRQL